jgi:arginyl-tRNA synthetase
MLGPSRFSAAQERSPTSAGAVIVVNGNLSSFSDAGEINLARPGVLPVPVERAARAASPHRLNFYLYDLAASFHGRCALGHDLPHLRFMQPGDGTLTAARLALVQANAHVRAAGLEHLGVLAPLEMR